MSLNRLKSLAVEGAKRLYEHPANCLIAQGQKQHIEQLGQSIERTGGGSRMLGAPFGSNGSRARPLNPWGLEPDG